MLDPIDLWGRALCVEAWGWVSRTHFPQFSQQSLCLGEETVPVMRKQQSVCVLVMRVVVRSEKMVAELVHVFEDPPEAMSVAPREDDMSGPSRGTELCPEQASPTHRQWQKESGVERLDREQSHKKR